MSWGLAGFILACLSLIGTALAILVAIGAAIADEKDGRNNDA